MVALLGAGIAAAGALGAAYMGSQGGDGMQQTGAATTQTNPDTQQTNGMLQDMARTTAAQPYTPYPNAANQIATFTPQQLEAFNRAQRVAEVSGDTYGQLFNQWGDANAQSAGQLASTRNLATNVGQVGMGGLSYLDGQGAAANASGALANQGNAATMGLATTLPNTNLSGYMSPYTNAVLAPALQDLYDQSSRSANAIAASSARNGAFGGSRQAILEGENNRATMRETGRLSALENQKAYESALAQFRTDQTNIPGLYAAAQSQQQNAINAANGALAGRGAVQNQLLAGQTALSNAVGLESAKMGQTNNLLSANAARIQTEVNPLLATGGLQQAYQQAVNDFNLNQFKEERDWNLRGLDILKGAVQAGNGAGSTSTTSGQAPNAASGALGSAAGAFGALGGSSALQALYKGWTAPGTSSNSNSNLPMMASE